MIAIKQALIDVKYSETMTKHRRNEGEPADNDDQNLVQRSVITIIIIIKALRGYVWFK